MKYSLMFIAVILTFTSCHQEAKKDETISEKNVENSNVRIPESNLIEFTCKIDEASKPASKLLALASSLSELENNYQIKSSEEGNISNSIVLSGLRRLKDQRSLKRSKNYEIVNFEELTNSISSIKFCNIKGTKDLGGRTYARAKIEEFIFKSSDCAINAFDIINEIKSNGYIWEEINKSPSSAFRLENRIYYISSGGWFMMDFYDEIANKMQE